MRTPKHAARRIFLFLLLVSGGLPGLRSVAGAAQEASVGAQLPWRIQFASNSPVAQDPAQSSQALRELSAFLEQHAEIIKVSVEGHSNNRSSLEVSRQRAQAIRSNLVQLGVSGDRLVAVAIGHRLPVADNATAEGRARNDRVEFRIAELRPSGSPVIAASPPQVESPRPRPNAMAPSPDEGRSADAEVKADSVDEFGGSYDRDGYYTSRCGVRYDSTKLHKVFNPDGEPLLEDGAPFAFPKDAKTEQDRRIFIHFLCKQMDKRHDKKPRGKSPSGNIDGETSPERKKNAAVPTEDVGQATTVFGVLTLGEKLGLPSCGQSLAFMAEKTTVGKFFFPDTPQSCVGGRDPMSVDLAAKLLNARSVTTPSVEFVLVSLGSGHCPDWKSASNNCVVGVALNNGAVTSVGFKTGNKTWSSTIYKTLVEKFGSDGWQKSPIECDYREETGPVTVAGTKYIRDKGGSIAAYWSSAGHACDQGQLIISTSAFEDLIQRSGRQQERNQPKL